MPKFDPQNTPSGHIHHRRSIRLQGYDYASAGGYYVTIVAWQRECLFGEVVNKEMMLKKVGKVVEWEWLELPKRLSYIKLGAHMVMPNHFHGILFIHEFVGATHRGQIISQSDSEPLQIITTEGIGGSPLPRSIPRGPKPASLGAIIAQFKSRVTKRIWKFSEFKETPIWQRNYGARPEPVEGNISSATPPPSLPQIRLGFVVFGGTYSMLRKGARHLHLAQVQVRAVGVIESNPLLWDEDDENPINANK